MDWLGCGTVSTDHGVIFFIFLYFSLGPTKQRQPTPQAEAARMEIPIINNRYCPKGKKGKKKNMRNLYEEQII